MAKEATAAKGAEAGSVTTPNRWAKVTTDRPMYKPDSCGKVPLIGFLVGRLDMPAYQGKPWSAFVIRTTEPTLAHPQGEKGGTPVQIKVGQEVLIPETHRLKALARFLHPTKLIEVNIAPTHKVTTKNGLSMWEYSLAADPKTAKARGVLDTVLQAPAPEVPAAAEADDIPF
jgi:hypothetical protein